jgi:hypothetical protein
MTLNSDSESRLSQFWEQANDSYSKIPIYMALNFRRTINAIRCIFDIPRLDAPISDSTEGKIILEALRRPCLAKVFSLASTGACILPIPVVPDDYSLGSSKQTLRRKVRAAEKAGISCRAVIDRTEQCEFVALIDRAMANKSDPRYREHNTNHSRLIGSGLWTVAFGQSGEPLVISVTPRDGEWALLRAFISLGETQQHSDARYLLTRAVVERLATEGVRHLVDTRGPSELTNGLRHFQRMLGFRIARVKLVCSRRSRTFRLVTRRTGADLNMPESA